MNDDNPPQGRTVDILEKETVYKGRFQVDRYRLRHTLHEGGWSGAMVREVFERGHAAAVLPYDPVLDCVVLIEQFRPGAYAAGRDPWLYEIVAGIIEDGETPEDVVRREAVEEAGVTLSTMEKVASCLMTPGACSESIEIYCGCVDASQTGGIHALDHEHEDIRAFTLPFPEARAWLEAGRFVNAITTISMQWLCLNRDRIRAEWGAAAQ